MDKARERLLNIIDSNVYTIRTADRCITFPAWVLKQNPDFDTEVLDFLIDHENKIFSDNELQDMVDTYIAVEIMGG